VARFLNEQGYHAAALTGGFDAWKNAGYPLEGRSA
jgi:rhodanese-related sulfurtransferase